MAQEKTIILDYSTALALVTSRNVGVGGPSRYFDALAAVAPKWAFGENQTEAILDKFAHSPDVDQFFGVYKIIAEQVAHWLRDQYPEFDNIMPKDIEELDQLVAGMGVPKPGRPEGTIPFPGTTRTKIPDPETPQAVSIWLLRMKARHNLPDKVAVRFNPADVERLTNG